MVACQQEKQQITQTARNYLEATSAYDMDESCQYCTPETAQSLQLIKEKILPQLDSAYIAENSKATIKVHKVVQENDTMAKVVFSKRTPFDTVRDTLRMVKRENRWMADVHFTLPAILLNPDIEFSYDTTKTYHALR